MAPRLYRSDAGVGSSSPPLLWRHVVGRSHQTTGLSLNKRAKEFTRLDFCQSKIEDAQTFAGRQTCVEHDVKRRKVTMDNTYSVSSGYAGRDRLHQFQSSGPGKRSLSCDDVLQ